MQRYSSVHRTITVESGRNGSINIRQDCPYSHQVSCDAVSRWWSQGDKELWIDRHRDSIQVTTLLPRLLIGIRPDLNTPRFPTEFTLLTTIEFEHFPIQSQDTNTIHTIPSKPHNPFQKWVSQSDPQNLLKTLAHDKG